MYIFTILFSSGPAIEYRCNREHEALEYAKRIANGRDILCIV